MKNRYSISSSKNVYSVVEHKLTDTTNRVSVIGTYDSLSIAKDVANMHYLTLLKSFADKYGVMGFVDDYRNKSLRTNDNRNCYKISVCDNLNFLV